MEDEELSLQESGFAVKFPGLGRSGSTNTSDGNGDGDGDGGSDGHESRCFKKLSAMTRTIEQAELDLYALLALHSQATKKQCFDSPEELQFSRASILGAMYMLGEYYAQFTTLCTDEMQAKHETLLIIQKVASKKRLVAQAKDWEDYVEATARSLEESRKLRSELSREIQDLENQLIIRKAAYQKQVDVERQLRNKFDAQMGRHNRYIRSLDRRLCHIIKPETDEIAAEQSLIDYREHLHERTESVAIKANVLADGLLIWERCLAKLDQIDCMVEEYSTERLVEDFKTAKHQFEIDIKKARDDGYNLIVTLLEQEIHNLDLRLEILTKK